ncbi:MAG TPA: asparagine synthase (glutamine-hydrolyzing) [Candidatus Krumholzibacteria bacterium]|nr:asparagine synthase (glutamine-hydrolyzing) [Candidatus Krumholzibacteria bacterium]
MCGICGIFHYSDGARADGAVLSRMTDVLTHRGPDDAGHHVDGPVALGMRRLSVIDLSTGHQPIYSEDRSRVIVCNGEIYNFHDIRRSLAGRRFTTSGDIEPMLHLYDDYGDAMPEKLRGMFAIALWDARRSRLLLVRDRLGVKPLYFADTGGVLVFASEIKAVVQHPAVKREVDPETLHHYLSLNYVPAPMTMLRGIRQLGPGELLTCDANGVQVRPYWDLRFEAEEGVAEDEWARRVRDKLDEATRIRLVSDVPFGAFLSGGVDSSAVVAFMAGAMKEPVRTFAIDFEEKSFSEAKYAAQVAALYHTEHRSRVATVDVVDMLDALIWYADDPLADSSMIPVYLVSQFARGHVTMVLTGDGGDEAFAGYPTYNAWFVREMYRRVPAVVRRQIVRRIVNALPVSTGKVSFDFKARRFVSGAELDAEDAHFWWRAILSENAKRALYTDSFREKVSMRPTSELYREHFRRSGTDDPLARMLYADTRFYLPADMLAKVDRMSMANALEARSPFLDHELMELAARIPSSIKFRGRRQKHILKEALAPLLPRNILERKKAGFNVPVSAWLHGELGVRAREILAPERVAAAGFFRPEAVRTLLDEHAARTQDHSFSIWGLLCFQLWHERFVTAPTVVAPREVHERWRHGARKTGAGAA